MGQPIARSAGAMLPLLLCVARPPPMTGQAAATEMLLEALDRKGWSYRVIDISGAFRTGPRVLELTKRALAVAALPLRLIRAAAGLHATPLFYLQIGQGPAALLRDLPLLAIAIARRWPVVVHVHGGGFRGGLEASPAPLRTLVRLLVQRSTRAVVLSPSLRSMFDGLVPPERVRCVDNGVAPELERAASHVECRDTGNELTILYLSNLIDSKGYVTVLEAARLAALRGAPYRFILAGAMTDQASVDPDAFIARHRLQNVRWMGLVGGADKLRLLATADALCLPTRYPVEGQPIAILEALHFGLPILSTRAGSIPDVLREGETGFFIEPDDPASLLERIETLAADDRLRERIAANNRALARSRFSFSHHADAMVRLLEEVADERQSEIHGAVSARSFSRSRGSGRF